MSVKVKCSWCRFSVIGSVVLASTMLVQVLQVEAKKPTPPPAPPVHYLITWLDKLGRDYAFTEDMNNAGNVVGSVYDVGDGYSTNHAAFVCVASGGEVFDLNEIIVDPSFDGWTATSANGINDSEQIVGEAENDVTGETRGFMFDPEGPRCILLPEPVHGLGQTAEKINNLGDIVAAEEGGWKTQYKWNPAGEGYVVVDSWLTESSITAFNDCGQILLHNGLRYTPGIEIWEDFSATHGVVNAFGMNNDGTFVGSREVKKTKGNKTRRYYFRFTDGTIGNSDEMLDIMEAGRTAWDVNSHGDVCITGYNRAYLYRDDRGVWALDNMVVGATGDVQNWEDSTVTYATNISDRDTTEVEWICGHAWKVIGVHGTTTMTAFLLTPVPEPEP